MKKIRIVLKCRIFEKRVEPPTLTNHDFATLWDVRTKGTSLESPRLLFFSFERPGVWQDLLNILCYLKALFGLEIVKNIQVILQKIFLHFCARKL